MFWTILVTIAIVLVAGVVRGEGRETMRQMVVAFRDGGVNTMEVAAICAAAASSSASPP